MQMEKEKVDKKKQASIIKNIAAILVLVVFAFFIYNGFMGNPLRGTWENQDTGSLLVIEKEEKAILKWRDAEEEQEADLSYEIEKETKQITFQMTEDTINKMENKELSEEQEEELTFLIGAFNYSVDGKELSLSEWDFGEQLLFKKTK